MRALLGAFLLCLSACSDSLTDAEVVGTYVASYLSDRATLSLKADRTYKHVIAQKNGQVLENDGTWEEKLMPSLGSQSSRIEFSNFQVIPSYPDEKRNAVGWSTEVEKNWLGRVKLCFDADVGYCYVKRSGS